MNNIKIGTCSWKYDSWKELIYPNEEKINYLKEYSQHFKTVEIDQWFWSLSKKNQASLPKPNDVHAYNLSTPDDFLFTIKAPNSLTLTHHYHKDSNGGLIENPLFLSEDLLFAFIDSLEGIRNKIGGIMLQFEYLNKQKIKDLSTWIEKLEKFFATTSSKLPGIPFYIEIRNPNYLKTEYFQFLKEFNLGHVFLEGYYMPSISEVYNKFNNELSDKTIIRLHGPDRKGIEKQTNSIWNKIVAPKDQQLEQIVRMILSVVEQEIDLFVNVNNHFEGSAPLTINKIIELINE